MSDEAIDRVGALLEQLGSRFELVLEAVSGYGARLDALREEIFGQFTEVGRQIRFLSEQIAENRDALAGVRSDLGAEIVRLGETLGATRVDFREQLSALRQALQNEMGVRAAQARDQLSEEVSRRAEARGRRSRNRGRRRSGQGRPRQRRRVDYQEALGRAQADQQGGRRSGAQVRALRRPDHDPEPRPGAARAQARTRRGRA